MQSQRPPKNIFLKNQSGQALLEYIALIVISLAFIIGIVWQFNDAFRQYMEAWFKGDDSGYLYCLIENGLLPGESETCTLPAFNLKNGKARAGGLGEANGSGGVNGGRNSAAKNGAGGGGKTSHSGDRVSGGGGLVPYNSGGSAANGANGKSVNGGAASASGSTGDLDFSNVGRQKGLQSGSGKLTGLKRGDSIPIGGDLGLAKVQGSKNVPATERDLNPGRFVSADQKKRSQNHLQDVDTSFSFGKILKYIIILIIGFSILFFVGSQLVAISRGNKKRN